MEPFATLEHLLDLGEGYDSLEPEFGHRSTANMYNCHDDDEMRLATSS